MIAFLIDADNLSAPEWFDEAFQSLEKDEGAVAIRRAYGSAENLKGLTETLRKWVIRPYANLPLSKNTTDLSLAVDAMELACQALCPTVVAIGSGDADFLPLVVRLRERGIKVVCVSERSKMSQEAMRAYDRVIYVGRGKSTPTDALGMVQSNETPKGTALLPLAQVSATKPVTKIVIAKSPSGKMVPAKKTATKSAAATSKGTTVSKILVAAPALATGQWHPLGDIARVLHDQKLLAKSASSARLFKNFQHHFELTPAKQPNQVRYILPPQ